MSYYHRALEKLESLEQQLRLIDTEQFPAFVRLAARGLIKTLVELRQVLHDWRYEGWRDFRSKPPDDDSRK